jgi:hypothetical protein
LCAIDEGIPETPVVRVVQFGKAIVAGKIVGRHVDVIRARHLAAVDLKSLGVSRLHE